MMDLFIGIVVISAVLAMVWLAKVLRDNPAVISKEKLDELRAKEAASDNG